MAGFASPWPWLLLAGGLAGPGLGLLGRALGRRLFGRGRGGRAGSAAGMLLLALGILAAVGLLVFPDKTLVFRPEILRAGLLALLLGLLGGLLPRALGLPLLLLLAALSAFIALALQGWIPLEGPRRVASLTPFELGPSGWSGELRVEEAGGRLVAERVTGSGSEAGLLVERLELGGPLLLFGPAERYRLLGIAGMGGQVSPRGPDAYRGGGAVSALLDLVLPLRPGPGGEASLPFVRRWREASAPLGLRPLALYRFRLDPGAPRGSELGLED